MRIFLYTYGLMPGRERLMPWRTVLEAAANIADCVKYVTQIRDASGICNDDLTEADVIFFPVTWRMGLKDLGWLRTIKARKIAYVPGGVYSLDGACTLLCADSFRVALPYILEALVPHRLLIHKLKKAGFSAFIGQSELTTDDAIKHGWPADRAFTALPGMDTDMQDKDFSVLQKLGLEGRKFLLYSGAPAPIRGSQMAIKAFDSIADKVSDTKFVLLMRTDNGSDYRAFEKTVSGIKNKDSFIIVRERLAYPQLSAFFSCAYAAVLPFLLIPSEMPLTYFDLLDCGTPVISFNNGGTTEYLKPALKIAGRRNVRTLAQAMLELCNNTGEREILSRSGIDLMKKHPSWRESSQVWIKAIEQSA